MPCRIAIRTFNGNYVTAVNGGGMGEPANKLPLHTDATKAAGWEKFMLIPRCDMSKKKVTG